jgi:DNA-binding response OmpR family regulator
MANFKALLCSADSATVACFESVLAELSFDYIDVAEPRRILDLVEIEHFDLIIVDTEQLPNGISLLQPIRKSRANRDSVIFGIGASATWEQMLRSEASVVLAKPVSAEVIGRKVREALQAIEFEHRRYNRQPVIVPVAVELSDGNLLQAESVNISEGGMAAHFAQDPGRHEFMKLAFSLPDVPQRIVLEAKLAWIVSDRRAGFRFVRLTQQNRTLIAGYLTPK